LKLLTATILDLQNTNMKLQGNFDKLQGNFDKIRTDITSEVHSTKTSFDVKLDSLEKKLLLDQYEKFTDLTESMRSHKQEIAKDVTHIKSMATRDDEMITTLNATIDLQNQRIKV
jgi:hypothetical protein